MWGNGEWIEALAEPIFVRGVGPFNGSGTAARLRSSSKMDSLAWLRCAGAGRACRRGGKPPGDWQSQCACPPKFPHMEFCIYPNKMPTHFILPESLIL